MGTSKTDYSGINDAAQLLERAQEAVNRSDPVRMLEALTASRYLDGLRRRLQVQWGSSLPPTEVDECVAQAVDAACAAAFKSRRISSLGSWLWKAADNTANDKWKHDYSHRREIDSAVLEAAGDSLEGEERRSLAEAHRREAIRIARRLLPRIGQGQVILVMEVLIDAAENRLPDLPASAIAEQVGITDHAARTLVSRGLKRLRRLAEEEGIELLTDLPQTDTDGER